MEVIHVEVLLWLIALSRNDIRELRLPNRLTVPAVTAALASAVADPSLIAGIAIATGVYLVAGLLGEVGGGDVKLVCALAGMAAGVGATLTMLVLAQVFTVLAVLVTRRRAVAHGPPLALGAAISCGPWIG